MKRGITKKTTLNERVSILKERVRDFEDFDRKGYRLIGRVEHNGQRIWFDGAARLYLADESGDGFSNRPGSPDATDDGPLRVLIHEGVTIEKGVNGYVGTVTVVCEAQDNRRAWTHVGIVGAVILGRVFGMALRFEDEALCEAVRLAMVNMAADCPEAIRAEQRAYLLQPDPTEDN